MKESDVQAAMDTQLKVAADGLWYEFPNPPLQLQQLQAFQAEAEQHIIQTAGLNNLPDPTRCAVSGTLLPDNPRRLPDQDQMCQIAAWSDPPSELLNDPTFEAIWQAIKTWDINVPAAYGGYCGATGNHVYAIHRALARLSPPQQPDPGDSLYEECLAVQDEPEILVTTEMLQAAGRAWLECGPVQVEQWTAIYRAMAALAPKNTASKWWPAQWQEGQACIAALEGENVEFKLNNTKLLEAYSSISKKLGELQTEKRNQVGLRIGSMLPGSCDESRPATNERAAAAAENNALTTQMDTLIQAGIQAYRDECTKQIAALGAAFESERNMRITMEDCLRDAQQTALRYKRDLAVLEAESAELNEEAEEHAHLIRQLRGLTVVGADLPDPPRRPDGTLAPASKPWTPPKDTGNKRRIGG